jgi:hypothetical protein
LLLAPSIQRFPLDIPPSRKQDDDRAQRRNGRKPSCPCRLDQPRITVGIGLDGKHVGHAQRLVNAGHKDHWGVVAFVAQLCRLPGAAVSPLCFDWGSHWGILPSLLGC